MAFFTGSNFVYTDIRYENKAKMYKKRKNNGRE